MAIDASIDEIKQRIKSLLAEHDLSAGHDPKDISDDYVIFGEGTVLDSLDAVELTMIMQRTWGIEIKDMSLARTVFASVSTLAVYVKEHAKK